MKRCILTSGVLNFISLDNHVLRISNVYSGFVGLALAVCLALLPQTARATDFQSELKVGTTFNLTVADAPVMNTVKYGNQNYLASNPECPMILGDHSYAGEPFVTQGAGNHDMETTTATGGIDTFIALYSPSFDPNNPTANLVTCDDDGGSAHPLSKITENLTPGTQYEVVVTTWTANPVDGTIDWQILPDIVLGVAAPAAVPTLSEWGVICFSILLGIAAVRHIKRQPGSVA